MTATVEMIKLPRAKDMGGGFTALYRSLREQPWYKNSDYKAVFIELLLRAQYQPVKANYKGIRLLVRRGQLFSCSNQLAMDTGVGVSQVKKALALFKKLGQINTQAISNKGSLITLVNYDKWQENSELDAEQGRETTSERLHSQDNKGFSKITRSTIELVTELDAELQSNKVNKLNLNTPLTPMLAFKIFWAYYPKKSSKKPAMVKFMELIGKAKEPNEFLQLVLSNMLQRYRMQPSSWRAGSQYCLHPSTYLNQARYEDEILPEEVSSEATSKVNRAQKSAMGWPTTATQSAAETFAAISKLNGQAIGGGTLDQFGQTI